MKNIFFTLICISGNIFTCQRAPKELHLHFDINKTIIAMDAVQGKGLEETINNVLAEFTFAKWNGEQNQSYYEYVTNTIAHENPQLSRASEIFKSVHTEHLKKFPLYLEHYHPQLLFQYGQEKTRMLEILNKKEMVIFPSFFKAILWLNSTYPNQFALYLRTFGKDLPEVVPAIESKAPLKFAGLGEFKGNDLFIQSKQKLLLKFFKNPKRKHYAIQDDYAQWKLHGFQAQGGKPFPIDLSNPEVIPIFFDDNANDPDKPIIQPVRPDGSLENTQELLKRGNLVAVNPKEAILDEDYFIKKIQAVYQK